MVDEAKEIMEDLDSEFGAEFGDMGTRESSNVAEGDVILKVKNAHINRSASGTNRKQLSAVCEVISHASDASQVGRTYTKNWGLENSNNFEWLNGDLKSLEIERPKRPSELQRVCLELMGIAFKASLVSQAESQWPPNCYINAGARQREYEGEHAASADGKKAASSGDGTL